MLSWEDVYKQYNILLKSIVIDVPPIPRNSPLAVSIEDLYSLGVAKLYECYIKYKCNITFDHLTLDEFMYLFSTAFLSALSNPNDDLKIEMKHKLTNGSAGGYTHYGLEEIKLREAARENAIVAIMLKHFPPEKHNEVLVEMEEATRAYYESLGLGEAYRQMEAMN
ncbi:hypothetical protein ACFCP7_17475 [Paenibacillus elgii]